MIGRAAFLAMVVTIFLYNGALSGAQLFNEEIDLSGGYKLFVRETAEDAVIVILKGPEEKEQQIKIEWAGVREDDIQKITLSGKVPAFFITAWDRSSTYGYQTNIIVWKSNNNWRIIQAPFTRGFAEDRNKDGIYELIDYYVQEVEYLLQDGEFIKVRTGNKKIPGQPVPAPDAAAPRR